ncbi:MAG: kinase [Verrucomicrobia bacterium]|nr:kinase [Verrucomicrobiota bacterium]
MIISRTPFRVSFFGGGTDFPDFYEEHGGVALATTIDRYCYVSLHKLSPFFKHRYRASYARTESVVHPKEFEHPLVRECLLHHKTDFGLEISHISDLPGRTGLGTSSAFTVGLLHALKGFFRERVTAEDLAREAIHIERERVKDAGGHQDQYAVAYGGFLRLDFQPGRRVQVNRLPLSADRLTYFESHILMFSTGLEQSAEELLLEQTRNIGRNEGSLLEMKAMAYEAENMLVSGQDLDAFGRLIHESWLRKRSLSSGISNTTLDEYYDAARRAGAVGGKLLGAGGRGFLLLWVPPERHAAVRSTFGELQEISFRCCHHGSQIIFQDSESIHGLRTIQ